MDPHDNLSAKRLMSVNKPALKMKMKHEKERLKNGTLCNTCTTSTPLHPWHPCIPLHPLNLLNLLSIM